MVLPCSGLDVFVWQNDRFGSIPDRRPCIRNRGLECFGVSAAVRGDRTVSYQSFSNNRMGSVRGVLQGLKSIVNEKFGDGIMSAIDFYLTVDKVGVPEYIWSRTADFDWIVVAAHSTKRVHLPRDTLLFRCIPSRNDTKRSWSPSSTATTVIPTIVFHHKTRLSPMLAVMFAAGKDQGPTGRGSGGDHLQREVLTLHRADTRGSRLRATQGVSGGAAAGVCGREANL